MPPSWVPQRVYRCSRAEVESRDEKASVYIIREHIPNYSDDPDVALRELMEDRGEDYTVEQTLGPAIEVTVISINRIHHNGRDALWQVLETDSNYIYCAESAKSLIMLSQEWSSDRATKWAYTVYGSRCERDTKYEGLLEEIIKTFVPVELR